jgi:hypothetical protein
MSGDLSDEVVCWEVPSSGGEWVRRWGRALSKAISVPVQGVLGVDLKVYVCKHTQIISVITVRTER